MCIPWQALNSKYCETGESSAGFSCISVPVYDSAHSGRAKLSKTLGSFFEVPFYLGALIPGYFDSTEFQFLSSQHSETDNKGQDVTTLCLACVPYTSNWQIPQREKWGSSQCVSILYGLLVSLCLQIAGVFFPFVSFFFLNLTFIVHFSGKLV